MIHGYVPKATILDGQHNDSITATKFIVTDAPPTVQISPVFMEHEQKEKVNAIKPDYYRRSIKGVSIDVYDIATAFNLSPCLFNALKYLLRAGNKQNESKGKDLAKAGESIRREQEYSSPDAADGMALPGS